MPSSRIDLRRYPGHWREGLFFMLGANALLAAGVAGVYLVLPDSTPLSIRIAAIGAALVVGVVVVLRRRRWRLQVATMSIDISPTELVLTERGGESSSVEKRGLTLRRLAYLRHHSGLVDHLPVLELRFGGGPTLRIAGQDVDAWPEFDDELSAPPRYIASADQWAALCGLLGDGASDGRHR